MVKRRDAAAAGVNKKVVRKITERIKDMTSRNRINLRNNKEVGENMEMTEIEKLVRTMYQTKDYSILETLRKTATANYRFAQLAETEEEKNEAIAKGQEGEAEVQTITEGIKALHRQEIDVVAAKITETLSTLEDRIEYTLDLLDNITPTNKDELRRQTEALQELAYFADGTSLGDLQARLSGLQDSYYSFALQDYNVNINYFTDDQIKRYYGIYANALDKMREAEQKATTQEEMIDYRMMSGNIDDLINILPTVHNNNKRTEEIMAEVDNLRARVNPQPQPAPGEPGQQPQPGTEHFAQLAELKSKMLATYQDYFNYVIDCVKNFEEISFNKELETENKIMYLIFQENFTVPVDTDSLKTEMYNRAVKEQMEDVYGLGLVEYALKTNYNGFIRTLKYANSFTEYNENVKHEYEGLEKYFTDMEKYFEQFNVDMNFDKTTSELSVTFKNSPIGTIKTKLIQNDELLNKLNVAPTMGGTPFVTYEEEKREAQKQMLAQEIYNLIEKDAKNRIDCASLFTTQSEDYKRQYRENMRNLYAATNLLTDEEKNEIRQTIVGKVRTEVIEKNYGKGVLNFIFSYEYENLISKIQEIRTYTEANDDLKSKLASINIALYNAAYLDCGVKFAYNPVTTELSISFEGSPLGTISTNIIRNPEVLNQLNNVQPQQTPAPAPQPPIGQPPFAPQPQPVPQPQIFQPVVNMINPEANEVLGLLSNIPDNKDASVENYNNAIDLYNNLVGRLDQVNMELLQLTPATIPTRDIIGETVAKENEAKNIEDELRKLQMSLSKYRLNHKMKHKEYMPQSQDLAIPSLFGDINQTIALQDELLVDVEQEIKVLMEERKTASQYDAMGITERINDLIEYMETKNSFINRLLLTQTKVDKNFDLVGTLQQRRASKAKLRQTVMDSLKTPEPTIQPQQTIISQPIGAPEPQPQPVPQPSQVNGRVVSLELKIKNPNQPIKINRGSSKITTVTSDLSYVIAKNKLKIMFSDDLKAKLQNLSARISLVNKNNTRQKTTVTADLTQDGTEIGFTDGREITPEDYKIVLNATGNGETISTSFDLEDTPRKGR